MINLILFGPPGSGKGTQAAKLVSKYHLYHISTGDMFREELENNSSLGIEAKSYMDKGQLVPDSVTIAMLRKRVQDNTDVNGFIFDGFPRTAPQAEALDELMESMGYHISGLIELSVSKDEIVERLKKRALSSGRADDANEDTIRNRYQVYLDKTTPVADYYEAKGKAHKVKGIGSIDSIFEKLCDTIDTM